MSVLDPFQLIIGFDTEYVRVSEKDNRIVSYQFALFNPRTGKRASGLITPNGPRHHHRFSLGGCLGRVLAFAEENGFVDTEDGRLPPKVRILIVAHFSRADLPGFRDFRRLKRRFTILRGTYATTERPAIFDVQVMHGRRRRISVTLCDTRLIAPASAGSIKALGELLGFPKLSVPDVIDEKGDTVAGITRMDLVAMQHPDAFRAYAVRDAEIAVDWLLRFARFADQWKLAKLPPTIAAMGVAKLRSFAEKQLPPILGKTVNKLGRLSDDVPARGAGHPGNCRRRLSRRQERMLRTRTASCRFCRPAVPGFRSQERLCHRDGTEPRHRLGGHRTDHRHREARRPRHPDGCRRRFRIPARHTFPQPACPRSQAWADLSAERFDDRSRTRTGRRPQPGRRPARSRRLSSFRGSTPLLPMPTCLSSNSPGSSTARARVIQKGSAEELMAKEAGNSLYGKTAQAVGNMKTVSEGQRIFDTRDGASKPLPPSKITCPIIAAYTSGLTRAVLSEILGNLPDACPRAQRHHRRMAVRLHASRGESRGIRPRGDAISPRCAARSIRTSSTEILEVKHRAAAVLVAKTRHAVTVELAAPQGDAIDHAYMLARGGHHLEREFEFDPGNDESKRAATREEAAELIELWRGRTYETKLPQRNFISPRDQWQSDGDLTDKVRLVRVSLDYDFKREPVDVVEIDGFLNFTTRPWADIDAFKAARGNLDGWIESRGSVLKNMRDWIDFQAWSGSPSMRSAGRRTPYQQAILVAWAKGLPGFPIRAGKANKGAEPTLAEVADILIDANDRVVRAWTLPRRISNPTPPPGLPPRGGATRAPGTPPKIPDFYPRTSFQATNPYAGAAAARWSASWAGRQIGSKQGKRQRGAGCQWANGKLSARSRRCVASPWAGCTTASSVWSATACSGASASAGRG